MRPFRSRLSAALSVTGRLCFVGAVIVGIFELLGWIRYASWPHYTLAGITHTMAISGLGLEGVETILNEVLDAPLWVTLLALGLLLRLSGGIAALGADQVASRE